MVVTQNFLALIVLLFLNPLAALPETVGRSGLLLGLVDRRAVIRRHLDRRGVGLECHLRASGNYFTSSPRLLTRLLLRRVFALVLHIQCLLYQQLFSVVNLDLRAVVLGR